MRHVAFVMQMKHRSQRHKRHIRKLKNFKGIWLKYGCVRCGEEIDYGKYGDWLAINNKGKKIIDIELPE